MYKQLMILNTPAKYRKILILSTFYTLSHTDTRRSYNCFTYARPFIFVYATLTFHAYYSGTEIKPYYINTTYALYTYVIIPKINCFTDVKNAILTIELEQPEILCIYSNMVNLSWAEKKVCQLRQHFRQTFIIFK